MTAISTMNHIFRVLPFALIAAASGCDTPSDESPEGDSSGGTLPPVTYWEHVAPIFLDNCSACHRTGGPAPFSLTSYQDARVWATASISAMQARTMPPWLMTADGSCGDFDASRWLAQEDIDTVASWAAQGSPEGIPRTDLILPEPPHLHGSTVLTTPNYVPEIAGGELAAYDEYRCFLLDPGLEEEQFLTGYDVIPGNDAIVHHVLAMPVDPNLVLPDGRTNLEVMQAYDEESPDRVGWPCFGAAGDEVAIEGIPVSWAPGQGIVELPSDAGIRIGKDHMVVVQMHYNLVDPATHGQPDESEVHLRLVPEVAREAYSVLVDPFLDSLFDEPDLLPPGDPAYPYTWEIPGGAVMPEGLDRVEVLGVFPHMHELGLRMDTTLVRDGAPQCIGEVPHWDFGWQLYYFYAQPLELRVDDTLRVTCTYDTSRVTEPVSPGWGTRNEMCLLGLVIVP